MEKNKQPIHIDCKKEDIAPVVIMPGDPLRAKYIAENFLTDAKLVTSVRNMFGYTGMYKGNKVTVMGHGMGMPSVSIYVQELFMFFDVQKVIRIGTAGVCDPSVKIPDIVVANRVYSESNFAYQFNGYGGNTVVPDKELVDRIVKTATDKNLNVHVGDIMTSDVFGPYVDDEAIISRVPKDINLLAEEMESYALIHVANSYHRQAACILTCVDSKYENRGISIEERQTALNDMIQLALDSII